MARHRPIIDLVREAEELRKRYPTCTVQLRQRNLRCRVTLQPTPSSATYSILITYDWFRPPRARVLRPHLEPNSDNELPHIYPDGTLCLHTVEDWAWDKLLADSIVPWTSQWLFFYEIWKLTGQWLGSGGNQTGPIAIDNRRRSV
jgi:hypothetical protein